MYYNHFYCELCYIIYITLDKTCYRLETMILKKEEEDFLYT